MHHRLMSNSSRLKFTTMKLLLQKIASPLRRHFCNRQPPLRQGKFQFHQRPVRNRFHGPKSQPAEPGAFIFEVRAPK